MGKNKVTLFVSQGSRDWAKHLDETMERWRIRNGVDSISSGHAIQKMKLPAFGNFISSLSKDVLLDMKSDLDKINGDIKQQLLEHYHSTEGGGNFDWVESANYAKRECGRKSQEIQYHIAKLKEQRKATFPVMFVNVAEQVLPKEKFLEIMHVVYGKMDQLNGT